MRGRNPITLRLVIVSLTAATLAACAGDRKKVQETAVAFVHSIETRDTTMLNEIMDWERFYSYDGKGRRRTGLDADKEKTLLLAMISRDEGLSMQYLTCDNYIRKVSVRGREAEVEILQSDRATGTRRKLKLLLEKLRDGTWKIYRFETKKLDEKG